MLVSSPDQKAATFCVLIAGKEPSSSQSPLTSGFSNIPFFARSTSKRKATESCFSQSIQQWKSSLPRPEPVLGITVCQACAKQGRLTATTRSPPTPSPHLSPGAKQACLTLPLSKYSPTEGAAISANYWHLLLLIHLYFLTGRCCVKNFYPC